MNKQTQPAVECRLDGMVRRLSDAQLQVARTEAEKPLKVSYWAGWDDARAGWCVCINHENMLGATLVCGPFATREEAEAAMGPEL